MERSQSFTNFDATMRSRCNKTDGNTEKPNFSQYSSLSSPNLRKLLEMRQSQQLQQQFALLQQQQQALKRQQQLHQLQQLKRLHEAQLPTKSMIRNEHPALHPDYLLQHSRSNDSMLDNATLQLNNLRLLHKRRLKKFQRQRSTESADDIDYAAEDEYEEDDYETLDDEDNDEDVGEFNKGRRSPDSIQKHSSNMATTSPTQPKERSISQPAKGNPLSMLAMVMPSTSTSTMSLEHQRKVLRFRMQKPQSEMALNCSSFYSGLDPALLPNSATPISASNSPNSAPNSPPNSVSSALGLERHLLTQINSASTSFDSSQSPTTFNKNDPQSPHSKRQKFGKLKRDNSLHSDSSHYSSVDSLLESRKPDPEAILINLGFGPVGSEDILSRIPKRFLKPSQVRGIDTDAFIRRIQLANTLADHSVLGYRGLIGNPDVPPSTIVAKIMERFEVNERKKSMGSIEQTLG